MDVINRLMLRNPEGFSFVVRCWLVQTDMRNNICQDMVIVHAYEVRWGQSVGQRPSICTYIRTYIDVHPNDGFWGWSPKVFVQFISNLAYALIGWVFRNCLIFGPMAKYLTLWWTKNGANLRFPNNNWKDLHSINFKHCWCAYWVSIQKLFHVWPIGQIAATSTWLGELIFVNVIASQNG